MAQQVPHMRDPQSITTTTTRRENTRPKLCHHTDHRRHHSASAALRNRQKQVGSGRSEQGGGTRSSPCPRNRAASRGITQQSQTAAATAQHITKAHERQRAPPRAHLHGGSTQYSLSHLCKGCVARARMCVHDARTHTHTHTHTHDTEQQHSTAHIATWRRGGQSRMTHRKAHGAAHNQRQKGLLCHVMVFVGVMPQQVTTVITSTTTATTTAILPVVAAAAAALADHHHRQQQRHHRLVHGT
jgi:hypothetical protein